MENPGEITFCLLTFARHQLGLKFQWKQYLGKMYFQFLIVSLCSDLFVLVLSLFPFPALALVCQRFTLKYCLSILALRIH